jgi:hypothetical protein
VVVILGPAGVISQGVGCCFALCREYVSKIRTRVLFKKVARKLVRVGSVASMYTYLYVLLGLDILMFTFAAFSS